MRLLKRNVWHKAAFKRGVHVCMKPAVKIVHSFQHFLGGMYQTPGINCLGLRIVGTGFHSLISNGQKAMSNFPQEWNGSQCLV